MAISKISALDEHIKHVADTPKQVAIGRIKKQPFFKLPDFLPLYCVNKKLLVAAGEIGRMESVRFITITWKDRVMRQPFYDKEQLTIKFRRPVPYVAGKYLNPLSGEWGGPPESPIYTMDDICWDSKEHHDLFNESGMNAEAFRENYEGKFTARALKPEYQELSDEFEARSDGCACHLNPPCSWCTDPGNPEQLHENDKAWEPYP